MFRKCSQQVIPKFQVYRILNDAACQMKLLYTELTELKISK
jgi:hypothetical protein